MIKAREIYKNMSVTAIEENGKYEIKVTVNGRITGVYVTNDIDDAMDIYSDARYTMFDL